MQFDAGFGNRQAQSQPTNHTDIATPEKCLKNTSLFFWQDANSSVMYTEINALGMHR